MALSKTQLDKLGDRLRNADVPSSEDRAAYDRYRADHAGALSLVQQLVKSSLGVTPVGRLKTLESTIAKLRRQRIRLAQIADIAGCRLVTKDTIGQQEALDGLTLALSQSDTKDYREHPQSGYRAVHIICHSSDGKLVEIQLRTEMQDRWANISEAAAGNIDMDLKYGSGPPDLRLLLDDLAEAARKFDDDLALVRTTRAEISFARGLLAARDASTPDRHPGEILDVQDLIVARIETNVRVAMAEFDRIAATLSEGSHHEGLPN